MQCGAQRWESTVEHPSVARGLFAVFGIYSVALVIAPLVSLVCGVLVGVFLEQVVRTRTLWPAFLAAVVVYIWCFVRAGNALNRFTDHSEITWNRGGKRVVDGSPRAVQRAAQSKDVTGEKDSQA
jgi:hypothetical protein